MSNNPETNVIDETIYIVTPEDLKNIRKEPLIWNSVQLQLPPNQDFALTETIEDNFQRAPLRSVNVNPVDVDLLLSTDKQWKKSNLKKKSYSSYRGSNGAMSYFEDLSDINKDKIEIKIHPSKNDELSNDDIIGAVRKILQHIRTDDGEFIVNQPIKYVDKIHKKSNITIAYEPVLFAKRNSKMERSSIKDMNWEKMAEQGRGNSIRSSRSRLSVHDLPSDRSSSINKTEETSRVNNALLQIFANHNTTKKVNVLRYREDVFRAASKIAKEMPPFPDWSYKDQEPNQAHVTKINVGGELFEISDDILLNMSRSNISNALHGHQSLSQMFIDRDPLCFRAVVHFYRTGRLHVPPNICLTYFQQELEFWGVNEEFMEPCCWSEYEMFRMAGDRLKKYSEDNEQSSVHMRNLMGVKKEAKTAEASINKTAGVWTPLTEPLKIPLRDRLNMIMTVKDSSVPAMWVSLMCGFFIILSVLVLVVGTTEFGRVHDGTSTPATRGPDEFTSSFFRRTDMSPYLTKMELVVAGFFISEITLRFVLCREKLEFFRDTLNWVDVIATLTSIIGNIFDMDSDDPNREAYLLVLKLPRILRLFKLTAALRNGMEAFTLTLRASSLELQVVFLMLLMVTVLFGSVIFVIEVLTAPKDVYKDSNSIRDIYIGMWWAIVTMSGVGYGDFIPLTTLGKLVGSLAIVSGIIICQMPVPIFLKNFSIYYNQASARLISQTQLLLGQNLDKHELHNLNKDSSKKTKQKKEGADKFNKIFSKLK